MSCRCDEMANCKSDMAKVQEIRSILLSLSTSNTELNELYTDLSSKSNETFTTINMSSLMKEERRLNYDISPNIDEMLMKCNLKTLELDGIYLRLKAEDSLFHGMEEVKKIF